MIAGEEMYRLLGNTGLYNLKTGKYILAELESYIVALKMTEKRILDLLNGAFIQICGQDWLSKYENLLGINCNKDIDLENRRNIVKYRFSISKNDCNVEGLLKSISSAGVDARIVEDKKNGKVIIKCNNVVDSSEYSKVESEIRKFMPAHLNVFIDIGAVDWNMLDSKDLTFDELDFKDLDWNNIFSLDAH